MMVDKTIDFQQWKVNNEWMGQRIGKIHARQLMDNIQWHLKVLHDSLYGGEHTPDTDVKSEQVLDLVVAELDNLNDWVCYQTNNISSDAWESL